MIESENILFFKEVKNKTKMNFINLSQFRNIFILHHIICNKQFANWLIHSIKGGDSFHKLEGKHHEN